MSSFIFKTAGKAYIPAIFLTLCLTLLLPQTATAGGHEKVFGVEIGYVSRNNSASGGLFFQYGIIPHLRLEADADIAFRHQNRDALMIDLNAHVPFSVARGVELYPLAGVNYSAWALHLNDTGGKDVTTRKGGLGLNVGGGLGLRVTRSLKLKVEASFTAVEKNNGARISAGIGYSF